MSNKNRIVLFSFLLLLSVCVIAPTMGKGDEKGKKSAKKTSKSKPKKNLPLRGIDVSHHQQLIKWKLIKNNDDIDFVLMKALEGFSLKDEYFERNWSNAKKHKIPRGAFHYFIASKSGLVQAKSYIRTVKLTAGDFPPILDIESTYGEKTKDICKEAKAWINKTEAYYKVKPIIYTHSSFYNDYLAGDDFFKNYPLWIADYSTDKPRIDRKWIIWQHSDAGSIAGIKGKVDLNIFNGSIADFDALLIQSKKSKIKSQK